jgi:FMN reductase
MTARSLVVISAGLGQPSSTRLLADRLAAATAEALRAAEVESTTEVVELRGLARPLAEHLLTGFPAPDLQVIIERVHRADGLIVVSPVFNASYSGLFKLFFDVLELDALRGVPVLLGATGGTVRHSLVIDHAMRPLFAYLGASIMPTGVFAATEDWGAPGGLHAGLAERIRQAGGELAAAMAARPRPEVDDELAAPPAFELLLRQAGLGRSGERTGRTD